ncbi:putative chromate transport protein [Pedobacter glucosidilyticus]|uniref:Chromate transporter n=1 Tax=Pedobacter aquae TaxID=2605747 RepID=A0A5C0VIQ6_9SPHI|nr:MULTISPECIES: chromate transporter [Pedobacter]KHJ39558.1 putative chromate transport protein [Pedobacter glucosidilyticus]QEK51581.1 chromate transporter [Pedobacter aquae]
MQKKYTLKDIVIYFLKLGTWGFGGPVALVEYMQRDLVEDKKWISQEEYKEGLALAQLAPGPLAAQLGIYLGFVHYRILGATLVGLAFVLPSFLMVLTLGVAYKLYSGLAWMQAVFYGVSAAVIGIIALSAYKLTIKSISKINLKGLQDNWLLWVFYLVGAVSTIVLQREEILLFILTGLIYMLVKAKPKKLQNTANLPVIAFYFLPIITYAKGTLPKMALFFLKAGAFVFGSGLAIVPFLHAGVVQEYKWLTENEFVDAVAVAMITPGPVVITVGFIGYLVAGFSGASIAAGATFLPCYLFTILLAPSFKKISQNQQIKLFVDGITATVIGALVGSVIVIASRSIIDLTTVIIALASVLGLMYFKKLKEPHIILIAALIGLILKNLL